MKQLESELKAKTEALALKVSENAALINGCKLVKGLESELKAKFEALALEGSGKAALMDDLQDELEDWKQVIDVFCCRNFCLIFLEAGLRRVTIKASSRKRPHVHALHLFF